MQKMVANERIKKKITIFVVYLYYFYAEKSLDNEMIKMSLEYYKYNLKFT